MTYEVDPRVKQNWLKGERYDKSHAEFVEQLEKIQHIVSVKTGIDPTHFPHRTVEGIVSLAKKDWAHTTTKRLGEDIDLIVDSTRADVPSPKKMSVLEEAKRDHRKRFPTIPKMGGPVSGMLADTATGTDLDRVAAKAFGTGLIRKAGETDEDLRARIRGYKVELKDQIQRAKIPPKEEFDSIIEELEKL